MRRSLRVALVVACGLFLLAGCQRGSEPTGAAAPDGPRSTVLRIARALVAKLAQKRPSGVEASAPAAVPGPDPSADLAPTELGDEAETTCRVAYSGPVTIVPVRTPDALRAAVSERRNVALVYATNDSAIYEDGRVYTTRVEQVGDHLNAVGWSENPMRILGASRRSRDSGATYAWRSAAGNGKSATRRPKRRRG